MKNWSQWLQEHPESRTKAARERIALALARLPNVLDRQGVACIRTLEMKLCDAGPVEQRVAPIHVSLAVKELANHRRFVRQYSHPGLRRRVKGLSEVEFRQRFGTEAACRAALFQLRWGKGWACPSCGHGRCAELKGRPLYQCNRCKRQVGLTAGTVFHWTKLPLTTWFLAIYHLTQSKGGMSSIELARRLGTRQPTAWLIKHKLMAAMQVRDAGKPKLAGRVEVDDAYLGGARPGGKRGRGAAGKTPFVAAVETTAERKPSRLRLTVVKGFRKAEIETLAKRDFAAGSNVISDGLSCWTAVEAAGCTHFPMVTGTGPQATKWVPFTWVNTALGNIKTALAGTYHHVSTKHAQRYLTSFAWRFNRRYQLDTLTERLAYACARTEPHPYRVIITG